MIGSDVERCRHFRSCRTRSLSTRWSWRVLRMICWVTCTVLLTSCTVSESNCNSSSKYLQCVWIGQSTISREALAFLHVVFRQQTVRAEGFCCYCLSCPIGSVGRKRKTISVLGAAILTQATTLKKKHVLSILVIWCHVVIEDQFKQMLLAADLTQKNSKLPLKILQRCFYLQKLLKGAVSATLVFVYIWER